MNRTFEAMNILDLLYMLKKHYKIIIAAMAACGIIAFLISAFVMHPKFQSNASIYINPKETSTNTIITMNDLQLSQNMVDTYTWIMKSTPVLEKVISDLGLDMSNGALENSISINGVGTTIIIQITVVNNSPVMAQKIAQAVINYGTMQINSTVSTGNIRVIGSATYSRIPVSPNIPLYVIIAVLLGFAASAGYAVAREMLDRTFKSDEDVTRVLGLNILGIIPSFEESKQS